MTNELIETIQSDAYAKGNLIIEVPLQFLMDNVVTSCDFDDMTQGYAWTDIIRSKSSDSGFGHLVDSILERGLLRNSPIGISWDDWNEEGLRITEGHHRLTAAILLCMDTVFISSSGRGADVNGRRISAHYSTQYYPIEIEV